MTRPARLLPVVLASLLAATGVRAASPGWEESGQASWYGGQHHGRRTSTGEVFDMNRMTAAHPTLPLGSRVRVTHEGTGESVVVTVNDRMPHKGWRVIDLSRAAAQRLDMVRTGTAVVQLTVVSSAEPEAEALDVAVSDQAGEASPLPRGRPQTRRVRPMAVAARPCCRAPFATQVRHSARRQAAPHRL